MKSNKELILQAIEELQWENMKKFNCSLKKGKEAKLQTPENTASYLEIRKGDLKIRFSKNDGIGYLAVSIKSIKNCNVEICLHSYRKENLEEHKQDFINTLNLFGEENA